MSFLTCILSFTLTPCISRRDAASPTGYMSSSRIWSTNQTVSFVIFFSRTVPGDVAQSSAGRIPPNPAPFLYLHTILHHYGLFFILSSKIDLSNVAAISHYSLQAISHRAASSMRVGKLHWHMIEMLPKIK